ncbi:uncharacterized protein LOC144678782 isoform X2 [Cetorhinus maximus]
MSDADEVAQAIIDENDTAKSDTDQAPTTDYGKEIANQDSSEIRHHDISSKAGVTKSPEDQVQIQVNSGQGEVKDHIRQDQAQSNSRQDEEESSTDKVQPGANSFENNVTKVSGDHAHVQESSTVQGTGEIQSQINSSEKDEAKSETGQIQIPTIDDVQDEAQSEVAQVDDQVTSGEQEESQTEGGQVDDQMTSDEQEESQSEVGQVDDQVTTGEQEESQSEVAQVDDQMITGEQEESQSEVGQVDDQMTTGEQEESQSEVGQVDDQMTTGEQEESQSEIGQVDDQMTTGEQEESQSEVGQVDDQMTTGEQEESQSEVGKVDDQMTTDEGHDEAQSEVGQVDDQMTTGEGHDEAQSEIDQVEAQPTSSEQEAAPNESGQNKINNDEKVEAKSATNQVKPQTNGGRAVAAKTAVGKVKPKLTGGRVGKLTGNRFPAYIGRKKKLATKISRKIGKASSDLLQAKSASGQAQTKTVLAKLKSQAKSVGKEKLNVVSADEVQPETTDEKEPMSVGNNASDTKETENEIAGVLNKDQSQADTDLTCPPVSTQSPASGGLPESGGSHASKEGKPVTMFWCDICKVVCTSALNLQMHFLGFKHKKIEAALKWNVHTEEGGTKDEFLAPMETRTVEDHLSKMKLNKAVLGLDYVVEYRYDQKTNPQFVCKLCYCKSELTWFLPHLLGAKHMANYLEKHHPYILKYEGEKLKPSEWKEFVFTKALEIEKKDGRGKVKVVLEKNDTKANEKTAVKRVAEKSAAEPECKVQKSEAAPSTATGPSTAAENAKPDEQPKPSPAQDTKENENWTGMYLYPDGLPINLPVDPKPQPRPVLARQEATATHGAAAVNDLLSAIGSKLLEDHITNSDFEETIIGLDFVTEYHYVGKTEPLYYCELCTCELPLQCVLAHIFGLKHKMRYVKKRHPELLKVNTGKYKTIVKKKAAEIEKIDGRGRIRVIRDYDGPALSERIAVAKIASEDESQLQDMEYSSFDQDQSIYTETPRSPDTRTKRSSVSTSSKPSSRTSSSKAGSRSDYKYSRRDSSTSKRDQPRKRESSKDIKRSGEEWRDEWERSIKRTKPSKQDKKERVKEKDTHSDRDKDRRKSRSDSKDDYKKKEKPRSSKDDHHKGPETSIRAPAKPDHSKREAIIKKEILKYLTSFKVINDTDAGYVKEVMYKLSNRLLQFGQKAMKITGSAEKLIQETKSYIPDENPRHESRMATNLGSYPGISGRDKSMRQSVEYSSYPSSGTLTRSSSNNPTAHPMMRNTGMSMSSIHSNLLTPSLLNSIRGMDENTITNTLTRLAANNPAFEGIRISTLVTVLREAGVLSKRPN